MPYKVGVLIIHGMGDQNSEFADDMIEELEGRIDDLHQDPCNVRWKPVHWAPVLEYDQDEMWRDLSRTNNLDFVKLRKFVISSFGDAIAYLTRARSPQQQTDVYQRIHDKVRSEVSSLRQDLGDADLPLIVIAHSLGSVIMSNYVWDMQKQKTTANTAFERMETLTCFLTFGCNIALASLAYNPKESITFPPATLTTHFGPTIQPSEVQRVSKWLNFFDSDDVLAYPLKALSQSYNRSVSEDVEINVGGIFSSWNPVSHTSYWTDNDFTVPVARAISDVLELL